MTGNSAPLRGPAAREDARPTFRFGSSQEFRSNENENEPYQTMHPLLNTIVICLGVVYLMIVGLGFFEASKQRLSLWIEASFLLGYFLLLHAWTDFPRTMTSFSEPVSLTFLVSLQLSVVAGILSNRFFTAHADAPQSWSTLMRPLVVAPMLLLPLLGSLDGCGELTTIQTASFLLLGFQNGFFWRKVFQHIQSRNREEAL